MEKRSRINFSAIQSVAVDYRQSIEDMIRAGNYDSVDAGVCPELFSLLGEGRSEFGVSLVQFRETISSETVIQLVTKMSRSDPWKLGKLEHLLAFGARYHEEQCRHPIVALGSIASVNGQPLVPYLDGEEGRRHLGLDWCSGGWFSRCCFLAVHT
jgi:hypothetical protein